MNSIQTAVVNMNSYNCILSNILWRVLSGIHIASVTQLRMYVIKIVHIQVFSPNVKIVFSHTIP